MQIPIDIAICLALGGIGLGALIDRVLVSATRQRRPSRALFNPRRPVDPVVAEWTPEHGEALSRLHATRSQR